MDDFINNLLNKTLGNIIDESRKALLQKDDVYLHDEQDKKLLEMRFNELNLNECDKAIINDYIACINSMNSRISDVSFVAGVLDSVKMLNSLGLLKEYK